MFQVVMKEIFSYKGLQLRSWAGLFIFNKAISMPLDVESTLGFLEDHEEMCWNTISNKT